EDCQIVCLDSLTYAGAVKTLEPLFSNPRFSFVKGDITDRHTVYKLFKAEHFDMVVNFAAESHVDRSIDHPEIFLTTNIIGTSVLLDAFNRYGLKRFHQVSTDEVYGDLPLDSKDLFTEETPLHTSSPYSSSKASADLLVMAYHRTYGTPVTISRCSNNYGPYQFPEKLIPLMISNARADKKLPVYGDGMNVRDWLYVEDHCKAIDLILHKGTIGEVYNVGGHNERHNITIVKKILEATGKDESLIEYVKDRPGHDRRYAIDASKIEKELGWKPDTAFEDGIQKTLDWYLKNEEWTNHILSGAYQDDYDKFVKEGILQKS
ncbi:MAG TPA: dTDP-glucose 4,6-dehydratase, partial [Clostridiales bacterium]|nr:dTDP-glucose 4,6-dehydratase [Clostridiales bacterium]